MQQSSSLLLDRMLDDSAARSTSSFSTASSFPTAASKARRIGTTGVTGSAAPSPGKDVPGMSATLSRAPSDSGRSSKSRVGGLASPGRKDEPAKDVKEIEQFFKRLLNTNPSAKQQQQQRPVAPGGSSGSSSSGSSSNAAGATAGSAAIGVSVSVTPTAASESPSGGAASEGDK